MKGISLIISIVLLLATIIILTTLIYFWTTSMVTNITSKTGEKVNYITTTVPLRISVVKAIRYNNVIYGLKISLINEDHRYGKTNVVIEIKYNNSVIAAQSKTINIPSDEVFSIELGPEDELIRELRKFFANKIGLYSLSVDISGSYVISNPYFFDLAVNNKPGIYAWKENNCFKFIVNRTMTDCNVYDNTNTLIQSYSKVLPENVVSLDCSNCSYVKCVYNAQEVVSNIT